MGTPINANVTVVNNFSFAADITLTHQFNGNPQQPAFVWNNVPGGGGITSPVVVTGNTGAGHDYWTMNVQGLDISAQVWSHLSQKTCTLESKDNNTTIAMSVSQNGWTLPLQSGGCSTGLSRTSTQIGVNVNIQNNFSEQASITLQHQYSDNAIQSWTWGNVWTGGQTMQVPPSLAVAIGSTNSGYDYWQISITLNNGQVWANSGWKRCTMEAADMDSEILMLISPSGWTIPLVSGGCSTGLSQQS